MLPLLPRELLWTDLKTMDEFFRLDPINKDFYDTLLKLRRAPYWLNVDAVKIFNEVYYQLTRMVYERPMPNEVPKYIADVRQVISHSGTELVLTMCYYLILLTNKYHRPLNRFFIEEMKRHLDTCRFWTLIRHCYRSVKQQERTLNVSLKPKPMSAAAMNTYFVNWNEVTNGYELSAVKHVLDLWEDKEERKIIALSIEGSMDNQPLAAKNESDREMLRQFFRPFHDELEPQTSFTERLRAALKRLVEENTQKTEDEKINISEIAERIKKYAEEAGVSEAYNLFKDLNNLLLDHPSWMKEVKPLRQFFREHNQNRIIIQTGENAIYNEYPEK